MTQYRITDFEEEIVQRESSADYFLDITAQVCPMTFVRAKLAAEGLSAGQRLEVRLNAGEPLTNVPKSLAEQGFIVEWVRPEEEAAPDGPYRLCVLKP